MISGLSPLERLEAMTVRGHVILMVALSLAVPVHASTPPNVALTPSSATPIVGGAFEFQVTLTSGGAVGFALFADVIVDVAGADNTTASGPCDGINSISAVLVNVVPANTPLQVIASPVSAPCGIGSAIVPHPLAAWGVPPVNIGAGAQLVTIVLPFGSFGLTQPQADILVSGTIHSFADVGHTMNLQVRGGFALGATPLNDSSSDPPALAPWTNFPVTPTLVEPSKMGQAHELEIAAGPSFPGQWSISVAPPPFGPALTNVTIQDCLVPHTTLVSVSTTPLATTTTSGSCVTATWSTVAAVAQETITFYGNNTPPWNPLTACSRTAPDTATVTASWDPLDPRDPPITTTTTATAPLPMAINAIAAQKYATPGPLGMIPGSTIDYRIELQITDYVTFGNLQLTDVFSDGVTLVGPPRLSVSDRHGAIVNQPVPTNAFSVQQPVNKASSGCGALPDSKQLSINISKAMSGLAPGVFPGNALSGALSPPTGAPAVGKIEYTVSIDDKFTFPPKSLADDGFVSKHDPANDRVVVSGRQPSSGKTCSDDSKQCLEIEGGPIDKTIVGRNGQWLSPVPDPVLSPLPQFAAGDTITFRIARKVKSGDAQSITVEDWAPKPVLGFATAPTVVSCTATPPAPNTLCFQSSTTSVPISLAQPPVLVPPDNHLKVVFKPFNNTANTPVTLEVFFTLRLSTNPFADGLHLTNVVKECELESYNNEKCEQAVAEFELTEPVLRITKGAVRSSSPQSVFTPTPPSTVAWVNPVTNPNTLPRFTPVIASPANTMLSDVTADANDVVTFAMVVENFGMGLNGAFDVTIRDVLPPSLTLVSSVQVTDGTGAVIQTTPTNTNSLFSTGIRLNPPLPGSLTTTPGANVAVITFNARVISSVKAGCYTNTASILHYTASPNGPNFVSAGFGGPFVDSADVCVVAKPEKCIVATSEAHTAATDVTLGEIVRNRLIARVPEAVMPQFRIIDDLPPGMTYLPGTARFTRVANQGGITSSLPCSAPKGNVANCGKPGATCAIPPAAVSGGSGTGGAFQSGDDPAFAFGTLTNADNDPDDEFLVIEFNAIVNNIASNQATTILPNSFTVWSGATNIGTSAAVNVTVVEPALTVTKKVVQGTTISYSATVTNSSATTAFDVSIVDTGAPCLGPVSLISSSASGGASNPIGTGNPITIAVMPPGSSVTIAYGLPNICSTLDCSKLTNRVDVTWTSLPISGTTSNPTGSVAGASGTVNGERNGSGFVNDYQAWATASLCGPCTLQVCGRKFDDKNSDGALSTVEPLLAGWTIFAVPTPLCFGCPTISGIFSTTTDAAGNWCLTLPGTAKYDLFEVPQDGYVKTFPVSGTWVVVVECAPAGPRGDAHHDNQPVIFLPGALVDFGNHLACATPCPAGTHCDTASGTCAPDSSVSPCSTVSCPSGLHCNVVNGLAVCLP